LNSHNISKNIIKAAGKDKEQTQKLLDGIKDKPVFEAQIKASNEVFKKLLQSRNKQQSYLFST